MNHTPEPQNTPLKDALPKPGNACLWCQNSHMADARACTCEGGIDPKTHKPCTVGWCIRGEVADDPFSPRFL